MGPPWMAQLTLPPRGSIRSIKKLLIPSGRPSFFLRFVVPFVSWITFSAAIVSALDRECLATKDADLWRIEHLRWHQGDFWSALWLLGLDRCVLARGQSGSEYE
ncbi:hypothetical protein C4D60_Mb04t14190 [Musa balbisiana]|uniref:Uncharacterized protein n=1 Tax=Musa balbisiana TaxID=52838 RepID=A0A4S8KBY9_MUSBA|nr:hypothetical protein C4D60_Mb04t14190 [Musa balbisiana]